MIVMLHKSLIKLDTYRVILDVRPALSSIVVNRGHGILTILISLLSLFFTLGGGWWLAAALFCTLCYIHMGVNALFLCGSRRLCLSALAFGSRQGSHSSIAEMPYERRRASRTPKDTPARPP